MAVAPEYIKHARENLTRRLDAQGSKAEHVLQAWEWVCYFFGSYDKRAPQNTLMCEVARKAVLEAVAQTTGKTKLASFAYLLTEQERRAGGSVTFSSAANSSCMITMTV